MRFKVTSADKETLLFVSQQAHPYWQATSQGRPLPTITINNFYLGAVIPPQTTEVELEFRPFVIWSWVPQVIYSALGFGLLIGWLNGSHEVKVKQLAPNQIVCYIPLLHDLISK
jgi:hypothetical protein